MLYCHMMFVVYLYQSFLVTLKLEIIHFYLQKSFPAIHKVGNVDIFVLPEFKKYDRWRNLKISIKIQSTMENEKLN